MLRAIIFDFNGIILDDEPLHFRAMQEAMADINITLTREDYWAKYLPFDDVDCIEAVCRDHSVQLPDEERARLLELKFASYDRQLQNRYPIFPGVPEFIHSASQRYPLALASGARRQEIETTLTATGLKKYFQVIVAAEDFTLGKPHPESFLLALKQLNDLTGNRPSLIHPEECLVIEDSVGGVGGAKAAGMKCLAVTNSYPPDTLQEATRVVHSLEDLEIQLLAELFEPAS